MYAFFTSVAQFALPYLVSTSGIAIGSFFLGVFLSQKVKDFASSTPATFRTPMAEVEKKAKDDVHAAIAGIFAKLHPPEAPGAPDASAK